MSHSKTATTGQLKAWLTLLRTPGIGPVRFGRLLEHHPDPAVFLQLQPAQWRQLGLKQAAVQWLSKPDQTLLDRDLQWLTEADDRHIITLNDELYPGLLKQIDNPPPLLFIEGDPNVLHTPQLAIVGSRNPGSGGSANARAFSRELSRAGFTITSGLALGIDAIAHQSALESNQATVAVMGTSLDRIYPARHRQLAQQVSRQGALVSEFPSGTGPKAENFPRRNRIISGLSLGTLVVEAAPRSGSLITARTAAEQGREVFAIPGSIHNPLARGCHQLIRQGAKLTECVDDILEELAPLAVAQRQASPAQQATVTDTKQRQILSAIGHDPISIDSLIERSRLTPDEVSSILLVLELDGFVATLPGGLYSKVN